MLMVQFGNTEPRGYNLSQRASLYVGDLHPNVTEEDLISRFASFVPLVSGRLCRCSRTGRSLCYGYVNFHNHLIALTALACLNHTELKGRPMRIMWSERDPSKRSSDFGNLFVKNLDPSIRSDCMERIFSPYGKILSCKVAEENGESKGFGFVQFEREESAISARMALNGRVIAGKELYVAKFIKKQRTDTPGTSGFTNLYVKNLNEDVDEGVLKNMFSHYGNVSSVSIVRDQSGKSKCFGFVNYCLPEDASRAAEALNGRKLGPKTLLVQRAQSKAERRKMLEEEYKEKPTSKFVDFGASNLYVKNLGSIDDRRLHELFRGYGKIISAKVMRYANGQSKGFGFVCFYNHDDAEIARKELNGVFVGGAFLFVKYAERKEDRIKKLQGFFAQSSDKQTDATSPKSGKTEIKKSGSEDS